MTLVFKKITFSFTPSSPPPSPLPRRPPRLSLSRAFLTTRPRPQASTPGALTIDAMCQEGAFVIDNISYYGDAKVGTELTAEADWKRRGLYIGPNVSSYCAR